jgi:hypothetical protein
MVDSEPLYFSSNSGDEVPNIIRVSCDSNDEEFVEFEPVIEVEHVIGLC